MTLEEGTPVEVRYPRNKAEEKGDRAAWPWLAGVVEDVCGPDEWFVVVTDRAVATEDDGQPAQDGTADEDLYYPCCFRDRTEIRAVSE